MPSYLRIVADNAVQAIVATRVTEVRTPKGVLVAQPEDWIVQDYLGRFEVYRYADFAKKFDADPADPRAATYLSQNRASPKIAAIEPTSGPGGIHVFIKGEEFRGTQGTGKVWFGIVHELEAASYTSWSDTELDVVVPAGLPTGYPVEVWVTTGTGAGAKESNHVTFTAMP